jgi:putative membrane protein
MDPTQWGGHGFGFMWIIPLLFFVAFIVCMRGMFGRGSPGCGSHGNNESHQENAHEILDKRYAKGEITKNEYEEMKKALDNKPS